MTTFLNQLTILQKKINNCPLSLLYHGSLNLRQFPPSSFEPDN
jgi:hypothetical protein